MGVEIEVVWVEGGTHHSSLLSIRLWLAVNCICGYSVNPVNCDSLVVVFVFRLSILVCVTM